ncbi:hypothetical protein HPP92_025393 [Vanilla planifolia]|uniref:Fe2OG dioxygenase domain-containing protein n=1 Tax=Vanilla planifolia TaxID=51239 RepID=A0A835U8Y5_VANPL|nr:hypothetical protein HPP92_025393 [Vanilla planifolia]
MSSDACSLSVVDLSKLPAEQGKLRAAVSETGLGCFRVVNHGIPMALLEEMMATGASLMDLPPEVKHRNKDTMPGTGYLQPHRMGIVEALGIYDAASSDDVRAFCASLDVLPHHRDILCSSISKLLDLIISLAFQVAACLGVVDCSFQEWSCTLRLIQYNFTEKTIGSIGALEHTDTSFITIISEDKCNGLEIMDSNGNFVCVDPVPETLLVMIGDIAKVWSNGRLHNVTHRVVCKKEEPRFSIALFLMAPKDNKVEPRAELVDTEHPSRYRSFDYVEYKRDRLISRLFKGETLLRWARDQDALV